MKNAAALQALLNQKVKSRTEGYRKMGYNCQTAQRRACEDAVYLWDWGLMFPDPTFVEGKNDTDPETVAALAAKARQDAADKADAAVRRAHGPLGCRCGCLCGVPTCPSSI
jgi:hypothetical protein